MRGRPLPWLAGLGALAVALVLSRPDAQPLAADASPPRARQPALAPHLALPTPPAVRNAGAGSAATLADPLTLLSDLLARDPQAALPQLEAFAARWPGRALPLYERLLARWAAQRQHAQAVLALTRAPLDADAKERLLQPLLDHWAHAAPDQAARWALATPGQTALLAPLHDRWLQQDARSATAFASTLPPGEQRQALIAESLSRWTAQDGPGARDWLRAMAPQPELDEAIARHASADELARHAPFEAMGLIARIAVPERRAQAWQALASSLNDIDPSQVAPLLAQAPGLTPLERQRLLDELR